MAGALPTSHDALPAKLACALAQQAGDAAASTSGRSRPARRRTRRPACRRVWFEYDDGKQFLRQAVAIDADHVVSLVLSASSTEARNAHVRAFEQALRTLRPLTAEEMGVLAGSAAPAAGSAARAGSAATPAGSAAAPAGSASSAGSGAKPLTPSGSASSAPPAASGSAGSAATPPVDAGVLIDAPPASVGSAMFISAPAPRLDPIGPCTRR